ncbi:MAG: bacillithiol biosynthesis deacetylase BshB1 [Bacteroidia bacterium]|nr:bacillithiol biosynthesis deacetylase BshB1 [Bacteroidia bacterium]
MKLDVLFIAAHPDDIELGCAGTICHLVATGKRVGIVDLTRGELGTRGSAELRDQEAADAAQIMGVTVRENMRFRDGFFANDEPHQLALIRVIRRYRPDLVVGGAPRDRHPDHGKCADLVRTAAFLSGLRKIETEDYGTLQEAWRPSQVFYMIQDYELTPSFVVDITPYWEQKLAAIQAYGSQFFNPDRKEGEPETYISTPTFFQFLEARSRVLGHQAGSTFGEGFICETPLRVRDITTLW